MLFKQLIAINSSNSNNQFMYETIQSTFFKKKKKKKKKIFGVKEMAKFYSSLPKL